MGFSIIEKINHPLNRNIERQKSLIITRKLLKINLIKIDLRKRNNLQTLKVHWYTTFETELLK